MTDIGPETMATPENNFKKSWLKWRAQNSWKKVGSEVNVHFIYALVLYGGGGASGISNISNLQHNFSKMQL